MGAACTRVFSGDEQEASRNRNMEATRGETAGGSVDEEYDYSMGQPRQSDPPKNVKDSSQDPLLASAVHPSLIPVIPETPSGQEPVLAFASPFGGVDASFFPETDASPNTAGKDSPVARAHSGSETLSREPTWDQPQEGRVSINATAKPAPYVPPDHPQVQTQGQVPGQGLRQSATQGQQEATRLPEVQQENVQGKGQAPAEAPAEAQGQSEVMAVSQEEIFQMQEQRQGRRTAVTADTSRPSLADAAHVNIAVNSGGDDHLSLKYGSAHGTQPVQLPGDEDEDVRTRTSSLFRMQSAAKWDDDRMVDEAQHMAEQMQALMAESVKATGHALLAPHGHYGIDSGNESGLTEESDEDDGITDDEMPGNLRGASMEEVAAMQEQLAMLMQQSTN